MQKMQKLLQLGGGGGHEGPLSKTNFETSPYDERARRGWELTTRKNTSDKNVHSCQRRIMARHCYCKRFEDKNAKVICFLLPFLVGQWHDIFDVILIFF
jgi:hypothetical protein